VLLQTEAVQRRTVEDSLAAGEAILHRNLELADSVAIDRSLPGGLSMVLRTFFNLPEWIVLTGVAVMLLAALALAAYGWIRRERLKAWFRPRWERRKWKLAFIVVTAAVVMGMGAFSMAAMNYTEHANEFCVSCHVMTPAFTKFQDSEHSKLGCHDCHRQSIFASLRQLYLWFADRPEEIPPHAGVPTAICAECHVTSDPERNWQRIVATAGHRVHLHSDSLRGRIECITCHGAQVHKFVPIDQTCAQSGCHEGLDMKMGKMSRVSVHCAGCHEFTAPVAENISIDSASKFLVPASNQCMACHEMRRQMGDFEAERDPHKGTCGMCHDPHTQDLPRDAFNTCATAGCHAQADTTPMHRGISRAAFEDCAQCHKAHVWELEDASCVSCHRATVTAPRRVTTAAFTATFAHRDHQRVDCKACHSGREGHGALNIRSANDCQSCHHGTATTQAAASCTACHQPASIARTYQVRTQGRTTVRSAAQTRALPFRHPEHRGISCESCHAAPVTRAVTRDCASCHAEHHQPERDCRSCHTLDVMRTTEHQRTAHLGCAGAGCHTSQTAVQLRPTRNVCLSCHQTLENHRPGQECAQCHQVNWNPAARGRTQ
jgi:hypothetical protein